MATSGTNAFDLDLGELIQEAHERAGVPLRSGYDYESARRSLDIMLQEWVNRGRNMWKVASTTTPLVAGTTSYTLGSDVVDVIEVAVRSGNGSSQNDTMLTRIPTSQYASIPNKNKTGTPNQYWINRKAAAIDIYLYPVPDTADTLVYWYMKRIEDTGKPGSNTLDAPHRFLPALVSGLAYYIAMKKPGLESRVPFLQQIYERQFELAAQEDREKTSLYLVPRRGRI
jgi:hypothetical protein